jgi:hypothetical protein
MRNFLLASDGRNSGSGLAREVASAAPQFGHECVDLCRTVAEAREDNFASRTVLGGIWMTECETFIQYGHRVVLCKSIRSAPPA